MVTTVEPELAAYEQYSVVASADFSKRMKAMGMNVHKYVSDVETMLLSFCRQVNGLALTDIAFPLLVNQVYGILANYSVDLEIPDYVSAVIEQSTVNLILNGESITLLIDVKHLIDSGKFTPLAFKPYILH